MPVFATVSLNQGLQRCLLISRTSSVLCFVSFSYCSCGTFHACLWGTCLFAIDVYQRLGDHCRRREGEVQRWKGLASQARAEGQSLQAKRDEEAALYADQVYIHT